MKPVYLIADGMNHKHYTCLLPLLNYWNKKNITYYFNHQQYSPENITAIIALNKINQELFLSLKQKYPNIPFVLIDHGCSNLKWFLNSWKRYEQFDIFLVAGNDHKRSLEAIHGTSKRVVSTAFLGSSLVLGPPRMTRQKFCFDHGLDPDVPIVLYAPTWFSDPTDDHLTIFKNLSKLKNHIISLHVETFDIYKIRNLANKFGLNLVLNSSFGTTDVDNISTIEIVKHADLVISDTSSILYEAAALNKKLLQVVMKDYTDNPAKNYGLPFTAGTLERFQISSICQPHDILDWIRYILNKKISIGSTMLKNKWLSGVNICPNAVKIIDKSLNLEVKKFYHKQSRFYGIIHRNKNKTCSTITNQTPAENVIKDLVIQTFREILGHEPYSENDINYHEQYISPKGSTRVLELVLKTSEEYLQMENKKQ